jgi:hypothetical protein
LPAGLARMLDAAPPRFARADESVQPGQVAAAREIIRAAGSDPPAEALDEPSCGPEFKRIRWFPPLGEALERLCASDAAAA